MGLFLTFSIFKNKESKAVEDELRKFASSVNGGFEISDIKQEDPNFCSILIRDKKTIVTYPNYFTEYFQSSKFLSKSLQERVYTFNIYDGDYWMLYIFENGNLSARFNPFQNYWSEKEDREQLKTWNFDLDKFCDDFSIASNSVAKYFIEWKSGNRDTKAYKGDEFNYGDCFQVFDLLKRSLISYSDIINSEKKSNHVQIMDIKPFTTRGSEDYL
ncbi:MAG: hypothetical protein WDO71_00225 [Bacteroidota bacterium]